MEQPDNTSRLRYSLSEAAAMLGVSRMTLYRRIRDGDLAAVYDGRRVFITAHELRRYAETTLNPVAF